MKTCIKCDATKPASDYYAKLTECKECTKARVRANRRSKIEYYRAYDRKRGCRVKPEYATEWEANFPNKRKAITAVGNAVRDGKLDKPVLCQYCGTYGKLHGHHCDYSKPLDVQWLCVPCHKQWHITNGEGLNG